MEIRPIAPDEHAELAAVTVAAYRALPGGVSAAYEEQLRDVAGRAGAATVLVATGERVLGGVTYVPDAANAYAEFDDPVAAGVRMLAVDPAAQGRGIGRALVAACIERARAAGRRSVVLHSTPAMVAAQRLYRSLGFVRRPDLDEEPVPGVSLAGFSLDLRS